MPIDSGTISPRGSGHHSARSFQNPMSMFRTENGLSGSTSGSLWNGTPSRCAIASPSRLWATNSCNTATGSPSAATRSIASGSSTGSIEPHPPVVRERVAGAEHRLPHDPGHAQRMFG